MSHHLGHFAPIYALGIAAGFLFVLALIGLFTQLLLLRQLVLSAALLVIAIVIIVRWASRRYR